MKVTALLLNYKRPENLVKIITSLRKQSIPIDIYLWNNNIEDTNNYGVNLQINSFTNLMCSPRWLMAGYSDSDYVFSLDDDLLPKDNKLIENCIDFSSKHQCCIGYQGVLLNTYNQYWNSFHYKAHKQTHIMVDIVKGRFIFAPKKIIDQINWTQQKKLPNYRIEDDIVISTLFPRNKKILPSFLATSFDELPNNYPLSASQEHKINRQKAIDTYFKKI
jgi:hypothetical protein